MKNSSPCQPAFSLADNFSKFHMATIAVQLVLQQLTSIILDEARLLNGLPSGIEELRDDLDSMRSFLHDAESRIDADHGLVTWIKQVRDVAYDTEDALDNFLVRFSSPPRQHSLVHSIQNIYRYILQLKHRRQLAAQIQGIKQRVKSISERRSAFSFSTATATITSLSTWPDPRIASLYLETDVVGIEEPKSVLTKWLVEGEEALTTISVVGMGGLGKTTLVKKAFDSLLVKKCFDCQAWVTVSKSFTALELLQTMLTGVLEATKERVPEGMDRMTQLKLIDTIKNHLLGKRYLIVLDDVWSVDSWESVKYALPHGTSKSRVIFTTRSDSLTTSVETTCYIYHLKPLLEKEAWLLFCTKAFRGKYKSVCPEELEQISRSILNKCEGLPLAIVLIGGLLSKKNGNVREWKRINDSLADEIRSGNSLESLSKILLLSYDDLPYYLKPCFLYLSIFPEDYLIKRMKLVRLWMVERFVEEKPGLTLEEVAEGYLNELVSRSMIQVVRTTYSRRVHTCRVHDLMREIIQMKSIDQSFATVFNEENSNATVKVRRLSIHDNFEDGRLKTSKFPLLRSLLLFTSHNADSLFANNSLHGFKLLRVLDLGHTYLHEFPPHLVDLIHLRYLSLRETMISVLPESIRKLQNLEILDLKRSQVSSLPVGVIQLKHLRQLRGYSYHFGPSKFFPNTYGMKVPIGIGKLTNLEKLSSVEVGDNKETVRDLGNLTQLRRLSVLSLREEDGIELCSSVQRMRQLTGLYVDSITKTESIDLNSLASPPQCLQHLFIKCCLPNLPGWIAPLQYLAKLVLQRSNLNIDPLNALQGLPSLMVLELRQAYNGEELRCEAKGCPKLIQLSLTELQNLKSIKLEKGAMPNLGRLEITSCLKLEMMPVGIERLYELQVLSLWDMPPTFISRIKESDGEDYQKVQHIHTITQIY